MRRAAILGLLVGLSACGRACKEAAAVADAGEAENEVDDAAMTTEELAAERCTLQGTPLELVQERNVEVGRAQVMADGTILVGLLRNGEAAIATLRTSKDEVTFAKVDPLGPVVGDAPPPEVLLAGKSSYALYYARDAADAGRTARRLRFVRLGPAGAILDLPPESIDESMAFDGAFSGDDDALLAWDDLEGDHGVVRIVAVRHGALGEARTYASSGGDATGPHVLSAPDGYWLVWSAKKVDLLADGAPRQPPEHALEGPGELRSVDWIDALKVDRDGHAIGGVVHVTPTDGHVGVFEASSLGADAFDVFARDAAKGSQLTHVSVRGGKPGPSVVLPGPTMALGLPLLFPWKNDWLLYADLADRTMLVPLNSQDRVATGAASWERGFDDGEVLSVLPGEDSEFVTLQMENLPAGRGPLLRVARCRK